MTGTIAPTIIDLFCGAGGFSLGFHAAGARSLAAVDFEESAGETFRMNFRRLQPDAPPKVFSGDEGDLQNLDLRRVSEQSPDVLIGGPPCQGFSRVGRAKLASLSEGGFAADARNELYRRYLAAVALWRPRAIVMENVPGMLNVGGRSVADEVANDLVRCGYRVGYAVLNAAWYGVPQSRERIIFIGFRSDLALNPEMPRTTHRSVAVGGREQRRGAIELFLPFEDIHHELGVPQGARLMEASTVGEALGDLPVLKDHLDGPGGWKGEFRRKLVYRDAPGGPFAKLMRTWPGLPRAKYVVDHAVRRTPRDYETFRRMKVGDRYTEALAIAKERFAEALEARAKQGDSPPEGTAEYEELYLSFVPPYPEDIFRDKWRKLIPEQPSWTVPAHLSKDTYSHIHYDSEQARAISIREAARLQSFPDGYLFSGNMGDCFRQVGNAVPPLLGWAIAESVLAQLGFEVMPHPLRATNRRSTERAARA